MTMTKTMAKTMAKGNRMDLGFGDAGGDTRRAPEDEGSAGAGLDLAGFAPRRAALDASAPDAARRAAEAAGFRSREPKKVGTGEAERPQRRRRTGRNAQLNIKARPDTIAAFAALADAHGWGFGETLEHAVALLEREGGAGATR